MAFVRETSATNAVPKNSPTGSGSIHCAGEHLGRHSSTPADRSFALNQVEQKPEHLTTANACVGFTRVILMQHAAAAVHSLRVCMDRRRIRVHTKRPPLFKLNLRLRHLRRAVFCSILPLGKNGAVTSVFLRSVPLRAKPSARAQVHFGCYFVSGSRGAGPVQGGLTRHREESLSVMFHNREI